MMAFNHIVVLGAGTMGHALATLFARGGHCVTLSDIRQEALDTAQAHIRVLLKTLEETGGEPANDVMQRVQFTLDGLSVVPHADMVVEVVLENKAVKRTLYAELAPRLRAETILTSNTSVLNAFELAPTSLLPQMVMAHYFVPTHIIPLVEIVGNDANPPDLLPRLVTCLEALGMVPAVLNKFARGFIINRIQRAINQEIFQMIENGVADAAVIDKAVTHCLGMRLGVMSYLSRIDFSGLDLVLNNYQQEKLGLVTDETPPSLLEKLVQRGDLGFKSGCGLYDYNGAEPEHILKERDARLLAMRACIENVNTQFPATVFPPNLNVESTTP